MSSAVVLVVLVLVVELELELELLYATKNTSEISSDKTLDVILAGWNDVDHRGRAG